MRLIGLALVSLLAVDTTRLAAATAREMYEAALAREAPVRAALEASPVPAATLAQARRVVAAYREVVRVHPTSGYSDNALWQAGRLSIDLFLVFGEAADRAMGVRLLRLLRSEYPSSSLLKAVPGELARLENPRRGGPERPALPATSSAEPERPARPATSSNEPERPAVQAAPSPSPVGNGLQAVPKTPAPAVRRIATIRNIRREVLADAVRVTIELDNEVDFHDERILNPMRVFVDLPSTRLSPALVDKTIRFDGDNAVVRQIRTGRHPNNVSRVVLEAEGVSSYSVYPLYNPFRLVIDSFKDRPAEPAEVRAATAPPAVVADRTPGAAPPPLASLPPVIATLPLPPATSPGLVVEPIPPSADAAPPEPPAPVASPPSPIPTSPPARNSGGGYSVARQLGLSVSRIVIDPGHGGHDPGAKGKSINESELVLDIALRVEKLLEQEPGIEVLLTRRTDEYVPLQERTAMANREGADLFLSIHANASQNESAQGVETYFLNFATNMSAAAVAARENAASGQTMGDLPDFLKQIALNTKIDESRDFARTVQASMIERLRRSNKDVKDLGVKQAPFVVLIGAAMPSVLAEISFVTNTEEARLLRSNAYRQRIAEALVSAIQKYQSSLKSAPSRVAQQ